MLFGSRVFLDEKEAHPKEVERLGGMRSRAVGEQEGTYGRDLVIETLIDLPLGHQVTVPAGFFPKRLGNRRQSFIPSPLKGQGARLELKVVSGFFHRPLDRSHRSGGAFEVGVFEALGQGPERRTQRGSSFSRHVMGSNRCQVLVDPTTGASGLTIRRQGLSRCRFAGDLSVFMWGSNRDAFCLDTMLNWIALFAQARGSLRLALGFFSMAQAPQESCKLSRKCRLLRKPLLAGLQSPECSFEFPGFHLGRGEFTVSQRVVGVAGNGLLQEGQSFGVLSQSAQSCPKVKVGGGEGRVKGN